jgi:glycosyltransferase involved in cell wall biosynthesis
MPARWIVLRERARLRWGGDLRRHFVLSALASRADALDVDGWSAVAIRTSVPSPRRWFAGDRPRLASATMLARDALAEIAARSKPFAVDIHDDPVAQNRTLGMTMDPDWVARTTALKQTNVGTFPVLLAPSLELAEIAELPLDRVVVVDNGSDTDTIRPMPFPAEPTIGLLSGAAGGRGIETLIEACRLVRETVPELRLVLWLAATGKASSEYLARLQESTASRSWIEYASAPYAEIGADLGRVTVQCVPNPRSVYWDAVSPIKLFDAMASGRPVVVTPRTAMRAVVERHEAGLVAAGDDATDLAESLVRLVADPALCERLGANSRAAAVAYYDWRRISAALAARLIADHPA